MATYTNSDEIKRRLRSASGAKVIFSDDGLELVALKVGREDGPINLDMSVDLEKILISDAFEGTANYKLKFIDDTNYEVYLVPQNDRRNKLIGAGNIATDFTPTNGDLTIKASTFGGTIEADDWVIITLRADLAIDTVNAYIEDVEAHIDSELQRWGVGVPEDPFEPIYYNTDVPRDIRQSATYLAVYYVYTSVLADFAKDDAKNKYSTINRMKKRAEEALRNFIKIEGTHAPSVISFPPMITQIGVPGVNVGMVGMKDSAKGEFDDWNAHTDRLYHDEITRRGNGSGETAAADSEITTDD